VVLAVGALMGVRLWTASARAGLTEPCGPRWNDACDALSEASTWLNFVVGNAGIATVLLVLLIGALTAGPLIARELESGTYQLAWTQSVTPARWLASKLGVTAGAVLAGTAVIAVAYPWSWSFLDQDWNGTGLAWSSPGVYTALGPALAAYALLAVAIGALVALLVRRVVAAMLITVLATGGVWLAFTRVLRAHLWPFQTFRGGAPYSSSNWTTDSGMLTASGERISWDDCNYRECMTDRGGVTAYTDYHPVSHLWPLQLVETGIVLLLAAAATYAAFRVLRRLHA
jgi:hypothetical protein